MNRTIGLERSEMLRENLQRVDEALTVMDRHAAEMVEAEEDITEAMRKRDRELKDSHLHSIPRPRKHTRLT